MFTKTLNILKIFICIQITISVAIILTPSVCVCALKAIKTEGGAAVEWEKNMLHFMPCTNQREHIFLKPLYHTLHTLLILSLFVPLATFGKLARAL